MKHFAKSCMLTYNEYIIYISSNCKLILENVSRFCKVISIQNIIPVLFDWFFYSFFFIDKPLATANFK